MSVDDPIERTAYVDTFFKELAPVWLNYVSALHGIAPRSLERPFTYLELGCGFGQSIVTNAAAYPNGEFYACDINAEHVASARRYAGALGVANLDVVEAPFDELHKRALPPFDFVVLHGVYSWIGEDAKRTIRSLIRDHLKPGGLAYVSYNCLPGWALEMPLRRLFRELAALDDGDVREAVGRGVRSLDRISDAKLLFFTANPSLRDLAKSFGERPSGYLAHEYLGEGWNAYYCIDVADDLIEADLHYVGSATLADNHPALTTADDASAAIAALPTARQRRLADDFATNRAFRRDVFVRGASEGTDPARLNDVVIARFADSLSLPVRVRLPRGIVTFQDAFVAELREILAQGTTTIGDIVGRLTGHQRNASEIVRNLTILLAAGELAPAVLVQRDAVSNIPARAHAAMRADAAARAALDYAIEHRTVRAIPSRVLGNGIEVQPVDAIALAELLRGAPNRADLVHRVAERLQSDRWFDTDDTARIGAEAQRAAVNAHDVLLPMFVRLGLVERT